MTKTGRELRKCKLLNRWWFWILKLTIVMVSVIFLCKYPNTANLIYASIILSNVNWALTEKLCPKMLLVFHKKIMANAQFFWKPSRVSQMHSWTSLHFSVNQSLFSEDLVEVRLLILMSFAVKKWSGKTTEKYSKSKSSALCYLLWIYIKSEK